MGVEIEENSELDLFEAFNKHAGDERIPAKVAEMAEELGAGNKKPEVLEKLAQYELTLLDWVEAHRGYRKYVAIAGKCWPAFQTQFGFVPCYVNSRLQLLDRRVAGQEVQRSGAEGNDLQIGKAHDGSGDGNELVDHIGALLGSTHRILWDISFDIAKL